MDELTALETEMLEKYTGIYERHDPDEANPDEYNVFLKVGGQRLIIGRTISDDAEHAEWLQTMLAKALAALVTEQRGLDDCRTKRISGEE